MQFSFELSEGDSHPDKAEDSPMRLHRRVQLSALVAAAAVVQQARQRKERKRQRRRQRKAKELALEKARGEVRTRSARVARPRRSLRS